MQIQETILLDQNLKTKTNQVESIEVKTSSPQTDQAKIEAKPLPGAEQQKLKSLTKVLNDYFQEQQTNLQLKVKQEKNIFQIQLVDGNTKRIIQKIPPDAILELANKIDQVIGFLIDKRL